MELSSDRCPQHDPGARWVVLYWLKSAKVGLVVKAKTSEVVSIQTILPNCM